MAILLLFELITQVYSVLPSNVIYHEDKYEFISEFELTITYVPGKANIVVDVLSCRPEHALSLVVAVGIYSDLLDRL